MNSIIPPKKLIRKLTRTEHKTAVINVLIISPPKK
jgi:hypothetical protein